MAHARISLICTVFNEGDSLAPFLESLTRQSRLPDEFVIVDGGSKDTTVHQLEDFAKTAAFPVRIHVSPGANIAAGRNEAIDQARHPIIAVTDAGCVLATTWLETLLAPLEADRQVMIAAGWYEPPVDLPFWQDIIAAATHTHRKIVNPATFLPSSRSIAFRKNAWEAVGGYPEWLTKTAEDTLFDLSLRARGFRQVFVEEAVVYWYPRPDLASLWKQYASYGYGDAEAGLERQLFRVKSWGFATAAGIGLVSYLLNDWRWLLAIPVSLLVFGYTPLAVIPQFKFRYLCVPIPKLTASLAQYIGYWRGLSSPSVHSDQKRSKPNRRR